MKYRDVLRFSLRGIRTSPLRSALSALSVAVGTGALLSPTSTQRGESIPCIAHGVVIERLR